MGTVNLYHVVYAFSITYLMTFVISYQIWLVTRLQTLSRFILKVPHSLVQAINGIFIIPEVE